MKTLYLLLSVFLFSEVHASSNVQFKEIHQGLNYNLFGPNGHGQSVLQGNVNLDPGKWTISIAYGYDTECSKTFEFLDNKYYLVTPPTFETGPNFCDIEITEINNLHRSPV